MIYKSDRSIFTIQNYVSFFRVVVGSILLVGLAVTIAVMPFSPRLQLLLLVTLGLLPLVPLYTRSRDVFSPVGFLGLAYLMGWFGPILHFVFVGDPEGLLLGNSIEYLIYPLLLTIVSIVCLAAGMCSLRGDVIASSLPRLRDSWNHYRAERVIAIFTVLGGISFALLVHTTGGIPTQLSEVSAKRRPPTAYVRFGTNLLLVAALLDIGSLVNRKFISRGHVIRASLLVMIAAFVPIYGSIRSTLILFLISIMIVVHYKVLELNLIRVLPFVVVSIVTANVLGTFRRISWDETASFDMFAALAPTEILGFFEAQTTGITVMSHIVHRVPDELGFQYGKTLFTWAVFPIPRAIWSGKPSNLGQVLGEEIYEQGIGVVGAGTPPPVPAELYLNFWIPGIVLGMYIFGILIRAGYRYFRPKEGSLPDVLLYAVFAPLFVMGLFRGDFSPTMVGLLQWYVPLVLGIVYITADRSRSTKSKFTAKS